MCVSSQKNQAKYKSQSLMLIRLVSNFLSGFGFSHGRKYWTLKMYIFYKKGLTSYIFEDVSKLKYVENFGKNLDT